MLRTLCVSDVTHYILIAIDTPRSDCSDGNLRLEDGSSDIENGTREGRLEICINNAWGTVCNTFFNIPDAEVACHQLIGFDREGK